MIIWSGKGKILGLFVIIIYGLIALLFKPEEEVGWMIAIFCSALLNLVFGHKVWNEADSFFFIPMKYWTIVLMIIGIILSVTIYMDK